MAAMLSSAASSGAAAGQSPVSLADLVEARSIDSIAVSPDNRRVAFRVLRPSLRGNRIEAIWYALPLDGSGRLTRLGKVGMPRLEPFSDGVIEEQPVWAGNNQAIMVLGADNAGTQVHLLGPAGSDRLLTHDRADVERFAVAGRGRIDYWTRNSRAIIAAADARDARLGIHFDRTIATDGLALEHNFLAPAGWTTIRRMDDRRYRSANAGELRHRSTTVPAAVIAHDAPAAKPALINLMVPGGVAQRVAFGTREVGLLPLDAGADRMMPRYRLASFDQARIAQCEDPACAGTIVELRLIAPGKGNRVYFLREDHGSARTRLYAWDVESGAVSLIRDMEASLYGNSEMSGQPCARASERLICVFAASSSPALLVAVDLASGRISPLYDPNRALRGRDYPSLSYLEWQDRYGRRATGVLALPKTREGRRPLVITTYRCRGLLQGGVGHVAPEFMLAEAGFAVLCINSNQANNDLPPEVAGDDVLKMHKADIEAYRAIIARLDRERLIDPARVGIAGHSYSANIIAYAVSHTDLFRAVIIGSGISIDAATWWVTAPTADSWRRHDVLDLVHLPPANRDPAGIWKKTAPSLNADAIHAAVLFQSPESEYLMNTQLYAAIQDAGGAADMYVYPGAAHMMTRYPVQVAMRAQRSMDWFKFWLMGEEERSRLGRIYPAWRRLLAATNGPAGLSGISSATTPRRRTAQGS
mgnify:CR=1 FL=1